MNTSVAGGLGKFALLGVACGAVCTPAVGGLVIESAERSISVAVEVASSSPFKNLDALATFATGHWAEDLDAHYSPSIFSTASQSTMICATGISGTQSVIAMASLDPGISSALAGADSRLDVVFTVQKISTFLLTAEYLYTSSGTVAPPTTPFLSVAGTDLFLPESEGSGMFALTVVLGPGTYTFSAITTAVSNLPVGGPDSGSSSIDLSYSFVVVPGPGASLLLAIAPLFAGRRRRG